MEKIRIHLQSYHEAPDPRQIDVLDGVRALCVLLVGWFHIWQQGWLAPSFTIFGQHISLDFLLRSGYIWVDGMLLLSGFLLYLPYTQGRSMPAIWPFYKKRLIRILPSYLLCILPMFVIAVLQGRYHSLQDALWDLLPHLTFTHTLFYPSYHGTLLNGALWTLGVEMQFYLLCPFLSRAFRRHPGITWAAMTGIAFAFRGIAAQSPQINMMFNQLPAFLDVYANGFLAASVFAVLRKKLGQDAQNKKLQVFFSALFILCICHLLAIAQGQSSAPNIQQGQLARRFPFSAALSCAMISAAFSLPLLRFLLGNPVMKFLSAVSFQFYIYHQMIATHLKAWRFPPSPSATPWSTGDYRWQVLYTLLCFILAILFATAVTYLFERPIARRLRRAAKE